MPDADRIALPDLSLRALGADFWSVRIVEETTESCTVRKNVALPFAASTDLGAMACVYADGGYGYAATGDTSAAGLRAALERAAAWAKATARYALVDTRTLPRTAARGDYASPAAGVPPRPRHEWYELLMRESQAAAFDARIVDWEAAIDAMTRRTASSPAKAVTSSSDSGSCCPA
jgi:predicted Zn-dependent protease